MNAYKKRAFLAGLLTLIGLAFAANRTVEQQLFAAEMLQGVVMDAGNARIMITPDHGDMLELAVAANARITRDGHATKLEELQARDHVSVVCNGSGQDLVATDIVAKSPL